MKLKIIVLFIIVILVSSCGENKIEIAEWEKTCLTNAIYRLAGTDIYTDTQRLKIAKTILEHRGKSEQEENVADVLISHPELYGKWGEDDIKKPNDVNKINYERANKTMLKSIGN